MVIIREQKILINLKILILELLQLFYIAHDHPK